MTIKKPISNLTGETFQGFKEDFIPGQGCRRTAGSLKLYFVLLFPL